MAAFLTFLATLIANLVAALRPSDAVARGKAEARLEQRESGNEVLREAARARADAVGTPGVLRDGAPDPDCRDC